MAGVAARTVQLDFDGVIHSNGKGWADGTVYGNLDFEGIRMLQDRGYAVVIASAGGVNRMSTPLREAGFQVQLDPNLDIVQWSGGHDGRVILLQPKCAAVAYVDDRAFNHQYDGGWERVLRMLQEMNERGRDAIAETPVCRVKE